MHSARRASALAVLLPLLACHRAGVTPPTEAPRTPATAALPADPPPPAARLTKNEIREVVRSHVEEVRSCYNVHGIDRDPTVAGRVTVDFLIGTSGRVREAKVVATELPPDFSEVGTCIAAAMLTWTFPRSPGDEVLVTYPFVLQPSDDPTPRAPPPTP